MLNFLIICTLLSGFSTLLIVVYFSRLQCFKVHLRISFSPLPLLIPLSWLMGSLLLSEKPLFITYACEIISCGFAQLAHFPHMTSGIHHYLMYGTAHSARNQILFRGIGCGWRIFMISEIALWRRRQRGADDALGRREQSRGLAVADKRISLCSKNKRKSLNHALKNPRQQGEKQVHTFSPLM